jgi:hypothetical protein
MVNNLVGSGPSDAARTVALDVAVATLTVHPHRVLEQSDGTGGSGAIIDAENGFPGKPQGVDMGVVKVVAVPQLSMETSEHQIGVTDAARAISEHCRIGVANIQTTGSESGQDASTCIIWWLLVDSKSWRRKAPVWWGRLRDSALAGEMNSISHQWREKALEAMSHPNQKKSSARLARQRSNCTSVDVPG